MGYQGFSKLSAYKAFRQMDNACTPDCQCTAECQLFRAKEYLGLAAQTGKSFPMKFPMTSLKSFAVRRLLLNDITKLIFLTLFRKSREFVTIARLMNMIPSVQ